MESDWNFRGANTRRMTHCIHAYPAMMIPQIAERLLVRYGAKAAVLFDPYCGTGTSLLEANARGVHAVGADLNPLARLIARAKTTRLNCRRLETLVGDINRRLRNHQCKDAAPPPFKNIDFWFSPKAQRDLAATRAEIDRADNEDERRFLRAAFSETVRECSYTRNGEFKLYRMPEEKMKTFAPDVFAVFATKLERNLAGMNEYVARVKKPGRSRVFDFNTVNETPPPNCLPLESADLVITSPPYGDSKTTVAYGQFSRLANEWLGVEDAAAVDRRLMGGRPQKNGASLECEAVEEAVGKIGEVHPARAAEIRGFYLDYKNSIANVAAAVRPGGTACYVVGNRKSKGVSLPTDKATEDYFTANGFRRLAVFSRDIPNKRMPSKNSPSNIPGACDSTMQTERVIIMRKQ